MVLRAAAGLSGVLLRAADARKPLNSGHVDRGIASVGQAFTCTVCPAGAAVLLEGSKIVCEGSKACPACERFRSMHERTGRQQRLFLCPAQRLLLLVALLCLPQPFVGSSKLGTTSVWHILPVGLHLPV